MLLFCSFDTLYSEEKNKGVFYLKNEREITNDIALSIRGLWHIDSMSEKKRIIENYDNLNRLFLLVENHPELFSKEELQKYQKLRGNLSDEEKTLISEIFTSLHMGIVSLPPEYTVDEVKDLYSKGLYFTKDELEEFIEWQFVIDDEKHNPELVILFGEYLEKHLYFDTVEEAEKVWDEHDASHKNENHHTPTIYLSTDLSLTDLSRSSCSTSPSTISLS